MSCTLERSSVDESYSCGPVVVGCGIAGLLTALSLAPNPILLIGSGGMGSSDLAQGGIATAVGDNDSPELHARDTHTASSGLCDEDVVSLVTSIGRERITLLEELGVSFDRSGKNIALGREAAHSVDRILHCRGDAIGVSVMEALWAKVHEASHIQILSPIIAEELLVDAEKVCGLRVKSGDVSFVLKTEQVILATGGVGQLFGRTTNPSGVCGLGLGLAINAGAEVSDLEFMQFHPTAIDIPNISPNPLATEALRGAGAILVNADKARFMEDIHPDTELAPRDVVARAIYREVQKTGKVYLDCRSAIGDEFPSRFPTVYELCQKHGLDPVSDPIPVAPAAHYHMGGVKVDTSGRTNIMGLFACGEVASTGLHGANRLASNSLLEAIVFAPIIAEAVKSESQVSVNKLPNTLISEVVGRRIDQVNVPSWLSDLMYQNVNLSRDGTELMMALETLNRWVPTTLSETNLRLTSLGITLMAIEREESRGGHFRRDFPLTVDTENSRRFMTKKTMGRRLADMFPTPNTKRTG